MPVAESPAGSRDAALLLPFRDDKAVEPPAGCSVECRRSDTERLRLGVSRKANAEPEGIVVVGFKRYEGRNGK